MLPLSDEVMLRAFGALLAVAGVILLLSNRVLGSTRLKAFGIEIETAAPALLILLLGCALFVLPSVMPERFASPQNDEPADYRAYDLVQDDTGQLSFLAPLEWGHHIGNGWHPLNLPPYESGERIGPGLNATPNFDAWLEDLKTPGVFVAASARVVSEAQYTPERLGAFFGYRGCVFERRGAYQSSQPRLTGIEQRWTCPDTTAQWYSLVAWPDDHAYIVVVEMKLVDPRDESALSKVLSSLNIAGAQ